MGLAPDAFWNMTLVEWRAALSGHAERHGWRTRTAVDSLSRAELSRLMQIYPDTDNHG